MTNQQVFTFLGVLSVLAMVVFYIGIYNQTLRLTNLIPEAASNIAVLIQKRTDLVSKLLSLVESYGIHETGISTKVASEFAGTGQGNDHKHIVARLASLRMAFPDLKADGLYESLMQELGQLEQDIAHRREQYNASVREFNTTISQFPNNLLLRPFHFQSHRYITEQ